MKIGFDSWYLVAKRLLENFKNGFKKEISIHIKNVASINQKVKAVF
jgi:hypothetical protein